MMKMSGLTRILLAAGLGIGLNTGAAIGQAGQDIKQAGSDTKARGGRYWTCHEGCCGRHQERDQEGLSQDGNGNEDGDA